MTGATDKVKVQKNNDAFVDDTDGYAETEEKEEEGEEKATSS